MAAAPFSAASAATDAAHAPPALCVIAFDAASAAGSKASSTVLSPSLAPPYRVAAEHRTEVKAEQEQRARGNKKKQEEEKPWFPSKLGQKFDERTGTYTEAGVPADYWPRQARAVGARLCYDERNQPELVLAALDSDGQLLDWCKVRWLHVNIRGRPGEPLPGRELLLLLLVRPEDPAPRPAGRSCENSH